MNGSIKIGIDMDVDTAIEQAKELEEAVNDMGNEVSKSDRKSMGKLVDDMRETAAETKKLQSELEAVNAQIDDLNVAAENLKSDGLFDTKLGPDMGTYGQDITNNLAIQQQEANRLKESLGQVTEELSKQTFQADSFSRKYSPIKSEVEDTAVSTKKVADETVKATKEAQKLDSNVKKVGSSMKSSSSSAGSMTNGIKGGIKSLFKYALALFSIRSIYQVLSRASRNWLDSNAEGAAQAKANMEALSNGMSQLLAPAIQTIIGWITTLMGYVNALTKAFFGVELFSAKTNKNIKGGASGAKKMNKEIQKMKYGFDDIEIASSNTKDNLGGGGGGGAADLPQPKIPTPDISGIMNAMNKIKEFWLGIWNSATFQSMMNSLSTIAQNYFTAMGSYAANVWDNLVNTFNIILPNLERGFFAMVEFYRLMLEDIANATTEWFPIIVESINSFVTSMFQPFNWLLEFVTDVWADMWEIMLQLWQEYGAPIVDGLLSFINDIINIFDKIWTEIINPILEPAIQMMSDLWNEHLRDVVLEFGRFVGDLILGAQEIWNEVFKPIINQLIEKLGPAFKWIAETIFPMLGTTFGAMADQIKNIITILRGVFNGLIKFITGVFSGDWKKAWQGVKDIFSTIVKGLGNIFKTPLNWIIDGINTFVRGLNRIKIPSWVPGVGGLGFNISQIPRLAKGGVLNKPTLNIAGEAGKEAVVPLQNNTGWASDFLNVLDQYGGFNSRSGNNQPQIIQLVVDKKVLAEVVNEQNEQTDWDMNGGFAWST